MSKASFIDPNRMRSYSSAFSRGTIMDIIRFNDFEHISWIYNHYDNGVIRANSYLDYLKLMYRALVSNYCCEYVYKNEIIKILLTKYGTRNTAVFNEFKVGDSIADIAFFNGESKVFEIKTNLDTKARLEKQISNYQKVFDKCYIVIPENKYEQYCDVVASKIGIITLSKKGRNIYLEQKRDAVKNDTVDVDMLMNIFHSDEYKRLIIKECGFLPNVPGHYMYDECRKLMYDIPVLNLKSFFCDIVKNRKNNNTALLKNVPYELRQICLSLNLDKKGIDTLLQSLNTQIN